MIGFLAGASTRIVHLLGKIAVDSFDAFTSHDAIQSAFRVSNQRQIRARRWHSPNIDAVGILHFICLYDSRSKWLTFVLRFDSPD